MIRRERSSGNPRPKCNRGGGQVCLRDAVHLALLCAAVCGSDACGDAQVRKSYEERRRKRHVKGQGRSWKLKRMAMDSDDTMQLKKGQQAQADKRQQDLERFMQVCVFSMFSYLLLVTPLLLSARLFFPRLISEMSCSQIFWQHVSTALVLPVYTSCGLRGRQCAVLECLHFESYLRPGSR